jgi:hypothetical protein
VLVAIPAWAAFGAVEVNIPIALGTGLTGLVWLSLLVIRALRRA